MKSVLSRWEWSVSAGAAQCRSGGRNVLFGFEAAPWPRVPAEGQCKHGMFYLLIEGGQCGPLEFEERDSMQAALRERLEHNGDLLVQYDWLWDEDDRCLLL